MGVAHRCPRPDFITDENKTTASYALQINWITTLVRGVTSSTSPPASLLCHHNTGCTQTTVAVSCLSHTHSIYQHQRAQIPWRHQQCYQFVLKTPLHSTTWQSRVRIAPRPTLSYWDTDWRAHGKGHTFCSLETRQAHRIPSTNPVMASWIQRSLSHLKINDSRPTQRNFL